MPNKGIPGAIGDKVAAADRIGVAPRTIEKWTRERKIPFLKISHRCVRYDLDELAEWAASHRVPVGGADR